MAPFRTRSDSLPDETAKEPLRHKGDEFDNSFVAPPPYMSGFSAPKQEIYNTGVKPRTVPHFLFAIFQTLAIPLALGMTAILSRTLALYYSTRHNKIVLHGSLVRPAWPRDGANLTGTYISLVAALMASVVAAINATAAFRPTNRIWTSRNGHVIVIGTIGIVTLALAAGLVTFKILSGTDGIFSWSCANKQTELLFDNNEIGLGRVCDMLYASWAVSMILTFLEVLSMLVVLASVAKLHRGSALLGPRAAAYQQVDDSHEHPLGAVGAGNAYDLSQRRYSQ